MKTASGPVGRMDGSPSAGTRARALVVRHIHSAFAVHSCPPFPCPVSGTSSTHYPSEIASSFPLSLLVPSEAGTMASTGCPPAAPFFGFMGAASALVFSNLGAAYGTAKSGVGVSHMGVLRPELVMRCVLPVAMAGVLGYVEGSPGVGGGGPRRCVDGEVVHEVAPLLLLLFAQLSNDRRLPLCCPQHTDAMVSFLSAPCRTQYLRPDCCEYV